MTSITIRKVSVDDLVALQKIGRQTFAETFGAFNFGREYEKLFRRWIFK